MPSTRSLLLAFGWASVIGSAFDGAIALYALLVVGMGEAGIGISVDLFLRNFLAILYWIKELARLVLPETVVAWIFALPALVYFPARVVLGIALGAWAFAAARRRPMARPLPPYMRDSGERVSGREPAHPEHDIGER